MENFFDKYIHSIERIEPIKYTGSVIGVKGLMIESYIVDGNQKTDGTVYGQSITDPCLGWKKTEKLIYEIADKVI